MEKINEQYFKLKELTPEEKKKKGILGRLFGKCADIIDATRNGRKYSEKLWDLVFKPGTIASELIKNGGIPGECGHPEGREEIDMEKIAIMMPEVPKKDADGALIGYWDILDTPCGRIAYQLAKYGFKLGISSRGTGDVVEDFDGNETVEPESYDFTCFDLVIIPAVATARLSMTESLNVHKGFTEAITESLNRSTPDDRKVMEDTLKELNIDINPEKEEDIKTEENEVEKTEEAANNDGAELVEQLQESLKKQESLEAKVIELQEQLSARYAREAKYEEELTKYKNVVVNLSESARAAKELKSKVDSLQEELKKTNEAKHQSNLNSKALNENLNSINSKYDTLNSRYESLRENYKVKGQRIVELEKSLSEANKLADKKEKLLRENLEEVKQNSAIKTKEYSQKLEKANTLVEHYKNIAKKAVDRYITEKARMLGISTNEIKNKLGESYSFGDIDRICEDLKSYNLSVSRLPFELQKVQKVEVTESKKDPLKISNGFDDDVDEDLIRLAEGYQQN